MNIFNFSKKNDRRATFDNVDRYRIPPNFSEWVMLLKDESPIKNKKSKWILFFVYVSCIVFVLLFWLALKMDWLGRETFRILFLTCVIVMWMSWIFLTLWEIWKSIDYIFKPTQFLAGQLDREYARERSLVFRFRAIPRSVLKSQEARLDAYISVWEKWLDIARIFSLLGTALLVLLRGNVFDLPAHYRETSEIFASIFVIGVLVGAIVVKAGLRNLHQVLSALKILSVQGNGTSKRLRRSLLAKKE